MIAHTTLPEKEKPLSFCVYRHDSTSIFNFLAYLNWGSGSGDKGGRMPSQVMRVQMDAHQSASLSHHNPCHPNERVLQYADKRVR